jgi:hypothetical protein
MLGANLAMHLSGYGPEPIRALIDPRAVWGRGPGVSVPVVQETLSARILVEEHRLYPEAIRLLLEGGWTIDGRRFVAPRSARAPFSVPRNPRSGA